MPNDPNKPLSTTEFASYWSENRHDVSADSPENIFAQSLEYLDKFTIGPYFWLISDHRTARICGVGGNAADLSPVPIENILGDTFLCFSTYIHPEDFEYVLSYGVFVAQYIAQLPPERRKFIRPNIYFRLKNKQGAYRWLVLQFPDFKLNDQNQIIYALNTFTDITHLRKEGVAMMSILDTFDKENQQFSCSAPEKTPQLMDALPKISPRELEVVRLLASGKASKQIADLLGIAKNTVENHRQNLLKKTNTRSSSELVAYILKRGIL